MGTIFWFVVGVIVGLFIPGPYNTTVKTWLVGLWNKIFSKVEAKS
jgi:hypothetical protein